jgi:hypothetical protein
MSKRIWQKSDEHPPLAALTLHLEGELEGPEAAAVGRHVNDCWTCRRELERLQRGVYAFVDYRREVLLPSVPSPSEPAKLLRRLREEAGREARPSLLQVVRGFIRAFSPRIPRTAWVVSAVSAAVMAILIAIWFSVPPRLTAAEFLRLARAAQSPADARPRVAIYQKVRIRRGAEVFQRTTYRGAKMLSAEADTTSSSPDAETLRALETARINWQDPLNAGDFAGWHDAQHASTDQVMQLDRFLTLKTNVRADSPVRAASFTVRQADWHPVARSVEFRDQPPLEITEIAYEIRELPPVEAPRTVSQATPLPEVSVETHIEPKGVPSALDLEEDELRLREAFHAIGADRQEAPEVHRTENTIEFRVWAENEGRRQAILSAAAAIPNVVPAPEPLPAGEATVVPLGPVYTTTPPLRQALWDYLGGMDQANNYFAQLSVPYDGVLRNASALARLAQRYSGREWQNLTPEMRARVDRVANDYVEAIRPESQSYVTLISPVLDEMLRRNNVGLGSEEGSAATGCQVWQEVAPVIPLDIRQLHTSFRRLFLEDQVNNPVAVSAEQLLLESARGRARLAGNINRFCPAQ